MPTRRSFIKQSVSAASAGLLHNQAAQTMAATGCDGSVVLARPQVRVLFSGLLAYRFSGTSLCDVDPLILPESDAHLFSVIVTERDADGPPYTLWRYFGAPPDKRMILSADRPLTPGVRKYTPTPGSFDRRLNTNHCSDWRWLLNLGELIPGPNRFHFRNNALLNGIQVTNGLFYTAIKTDSVRTTVTHECASPSASRGDLNSVASVLGANLYLADDATATLRGPDGDIRMRNRPNVAYEVYIEYNPGRVVTPAVRVRTRTHFHRYYGALDPPQSECDIFFMLLTANKRNATPDVPCMGLED